MTELRLLALVVGDQDTASTRYRVLAYVEPLRSAGIATEVRFEPRRTGLVPIDRARRLLELLATTRRPDADLVLVQRRTFPPPFARRLARHDRPRVFDFDDAIFLPPPRLETAGRALHARYRRNFDATLAAVDHVICGSSELASHLPERRPTILPTPLDTRRFRPAAIRPPDRPALGWVGHSDNLGTLEALADPLRELSRRHPGLRVIVAADRPPRLDGLELEYRRWSRESEVSCFDGVGIGLMPLRDTPWDRSKCAFKLLQYMALGLPAVASPVGMNREVVEHGVNGLLADSAEDWAAAVDRLLRDPGLARRLGEAGRRTVETRFDVTVLAPRLAELLTRVWRRAHGGDG